jgi:hypothetical protein
MKLSAKDVKKGDTIIEVNAWNFISDWKRNIKKGKTAIEDDIYRTTQWTVHSCGKKQMKLMDDKGMAKKLILIDEKGNFSSTIVKNYVDAHKSVQEMFLEDKYSTDNYTIEEHRY